MMQKDIPETWEMRSVESVCARVTTGGTPSRRRSDFFVNGTIPWFKTGELKDRLLFDSEEHITEEGLGASSAKVFPPNTVLMAMYGDGDTITTLGVLRHPAATNQACCAMIPDPDICDWRYLFYALKHTRSALLRVVVGGAQRNLSGAIIRQHKVPLPPLSEQKAIAGILGALDDKIELNRRMNATLEAMARALFQSWFIDFDPVRRNMDRNQPSPPAPLPEVEGSDPVRRNMDRTQNQMCMFSHPSPSSSTSGRGQGEGASRGRRDGDEGSVEAIDRLFPDSFQDSPLGHIPKGWTVGTVGDIGTNLRRGVQPCHIAPNTPYIALEHMPRRSIALSDWDDSADVVSGKSAFKKGEILFGKLRPYFHKVGVAPFDGVCSTDILVLAPKSPEWFGFLLGHASSDELIQLTDLASTGTKMPRTNWRDISSFKISLPPKTVAAAYTHIIQLILCQIHANIHQSRTLATLRDTLLPKLLSGELSVAKMQKEVSA